MSLAELSGGVTNAADLVSARRSMLAGLDDHPEWSPLEASLAERLRECFAAHPPYLQRIDVHSEPAILAQIIKYEAVHAIRSQQDLQRRLAADRRCYALFSDALPGQPLVFTELAFTDGLCADVGNVLDTSAPVVDPMSCECGTFYSISSCDEGLRGIPFGNTLIRAVVSRLREETPWVRTFATASPVPGFRAWLDAAARRVGGRVAEVVDALNQPGWAERRDAGQQLEAVLMPLCAAYLVLAKRGDDPLDPVARFHLGNGAQLQRINWLGDRSDAGLRRSAGITANYVYDLPTLDANRDSYRTARRVVAAPALVDLARLAA